MEDAHNYDPTRKKAWDGGQIYRRHPQFRKSHYARSQRKMGVQYRYYKNVSLTGVPVAFTWDHDLSGYAVVSRIRLQLQNYRGRYDVYEKNWK